MEAITQLLGREIGEGTRIVLNHDIVYRLRSAFAQGTIRQACEECPWYRLCTKVARANYRRCGCSPTGSES